MATAKKTASKTTPSRARRSTTAVPPGPAPKATAKAATAKVKAKAEKAPKAPKAEKAEKPRKPKMVRDSFTIPKAEYAVIEALKDRAARLGRPTKKSEVLRAGVKALEAMGDAAFLASVGAVPAVKTGRPAKA
ncbi:hypothetical protein [Ramlibacter pallidus]|uniref:Histone H1 n=1 Tax=Ramlibacter pallidus TaxID=2780087 RepID=A0ABR9S383_9BURK|nr:hypothetical protein [Ramlibacter pallidus]MBE7367950.1 hypothetical protein [Ramlibacter pallidus]